MNFALSDEQEFLKEAARGALSRVKTVEAAREALDGGALPDLWPTAVEAGWPACWSPRSTAAPASAARGDARVRGARPRARRASRCSATCRRRSCSTARRAARPRQALAAGEARAAYVPARPPTDLEDGWTVEPALGLTRAPAPSSPTARSPAPCPGCRTRRAPTTSSSCSTTAARRSCAAADAQDRAGDRLRRHPLARPRDVRRRAGDAARPRPGATPRRRGTSRRR